MLFQDRYDAGSQLADRLREYQGTDSIVLALPRGGAVVGYQVALALQLPLDVIITRKIGPPGNSEYAIGAVTENGEVSLNDYEIAAYGISDSYLRAALEQQRQEISRRVQLYRDGRALPPLTNRNVILVDDGIATGFTVATTLKALRKENPRELVLAVPVAPQETLDRLGKLADKAVCLATPEPFLAVGRFYINFEQIDDVEVRKVLDASGARWGSQERDAQGGLGRRP